MGQGAGRGDKKPGSFSLKTMEILSTLDQRDAINFTKIAPYVIDDDFIPAGAFEKSAYLFLMLPTLTAWD